MSQMSRTRSSIGEHNASQHALLKVEDIASLAIAPRARGVLPDMSGYEGILTQVLVPNTVFETRRARSPSRLGASSRRSHSVSPVGLTIAQRQAQLASHMASTTALNVGRVVATTDVMCNVAE